jgi:endonuclease YncB( thermonuclease family)
MLLAVLVLIAGTGAGVGAFALAEEPPADTGRPPSSAPPPVQDQPPPVQDHSTADDTPAPRLWKVGSVLDAMTLKLSNGARVRLAGVAGGCAPIGLGRLVTGEWVSLERGGPDKDASGRLVRYVDLNGVDIGRRLIQRGWARAGDEPNPRRAIYRKIDERTPDVCS